MSSTAAGLYVDKVKQVVVFSIPWIQVEGYNEIYCQKPVQVKAEACLWGWCESIMLQNEGFVFYSLITGLAWEHEEVCNSWSQKISSRHWDYLILSK